jgi:hypothetical protein
MQTVQKIILLIMSVFLCACNVQREEEPAEKIVVSPGFVEPAAESPQKTENRIVVVFGYGYTDSPFYENTLSLLETHFGLDKDDLFSNFDTDKSSLFIMLKVNDQNIF